ncbi:hypothetical protein NP233_g9917 [Leucocoprinus birnbaumii]|uniref:DUF6535 domain-containing protein n=1 Tax=Leucocoprinus birnbaumii TaxID=56174 RepID=A0AAD5VLW5_9AGAR|nr:hypothetical protein NP233_g9917 [Leucocoprinus birnbaumii]
MDHLSKSFRLGTNRTQRERERAGREHDTLFHDKETRSKRSSYSRADWTCEREPYRYPIDESPKDPWERCYDVVDKSDEELCKDLKDEISYLLVVASLFLGIVTAFTMESMKWIHLDQGDATNQLLNQVVVLLNDTSKQGTATGVSSTASVPEDYAIIVSQLWFLSMTLSLSAVVVGTLCLQWLSAFRRTDIKYMPHEEALALRQLRFEGLIWWHVPRVPAILLLTVQGALVLFAIGLLYLLWNINRRVALPVAIVSGIAVFFVEPNDSNASIAIDARLAHPKNACDSPMSLQIPPLLGSSSWLRCIGPPILSSFLLDTILQEKDESLVQATN